MAVYMCVFRSMYVTDLSKQSAQNKRYLSDTEEASLTAYIEYASDKGFPLTVSLVKFFANEIVAKRNFTDASRSFGESGPSNGWWAGFKYVYFHQLHIIIFAWITNLSAPAHFTTSFLN